MSSLAVITGGNVGVGYALAGRLLTEYPEMKLCLACRNQDKAEAARIALLKDHPDASISIVLLDTSNPASVVAASKEMKKRFSHIDLLYLNAGIMPEPRVHWKALWSGLFSKKIVHIFTTGEGLLSVKDSVTAEGLQNTFATNLFGHFILVDELEGVLGGNDRTSQVIWTSSSNASKEAFNLDDIQHRNGKEPYASSKYGQDLLSVALNHNLNKKGVYSHLTCPGLVMTSLTFNILPAWFWALLMPFFWLMRLFTSSITLSPYNGAEALLWLSGQRAQALDPCKKYTSRTSLFGRNYTLPVKIDVKLEDSLMLLKKLKDLKQEHLHNIS